MKAEGIQNVPFCFYFVLVNVIALPILCLLRIILYPWQRVSSLLFAQAGDHTTRRLPPAIGATVKEATAEHTLDTVVLLHGFPDDPTLWDGTVRFLTAQGYRCILISFPGCYGEDVRHPPVLRDVARGIVSAIDSVTPGDPRSQSFTLLGHDWGSFYADQVRKHFPQRVHRLIQVDAGDFLDYSASRYMLLCIFSHQLILFTIYGLRHPVGTVVFRAWEKLIHDCFGKMDRPMAQFRSDMTWYYPTILRTVVKMRGLPPSSPHATAATPATRKKTDNDDDDDGTAFERDSRGSKSLPRLFVYGRQKVFHFHDEKFLEHVGQSPGGEVHALDGGHWIMNDDKDRWCEVVRRWLIQSSKVIAKAE